MADDPRYGDMDVFHSIEFDCCVFIRVITWKIFIFIYCTVMLPEDLQA